MIISPRPGFKRPRARGNIGMKSAWWLTQRAKRIGARRLRRRRYAYPSIKQEPKFYDYTYPATALVANTTAASLELHAATSAALALPSVGDGEQNRDGKKIVVTALEVKGRVSLDSVAATAAPPNRIWCWVALVLDTQVNGTQMNSEDCFKYIQTADAQDCIPFRNLLFGGRFRILKMWNFNFTDRNFVSGVATYSYAASQRGFKYFKKMRLPINFNGGNTSDIANVIDNNLYMIGGANVATAAEVTYSSRIRFVG